MGKPLNSNSSGGVDKAGILAGIYHDHTHPAGLGGVKKLLDYAQRVDSTITLADVKKFLKSSDVYTLHYVPPVKYVRLPIVAPKPGVFLSCDLGDMSGLSKHNKGYKYILIAVDIFSRFLHVRLLRSKTGPDTRDALESILNHPRVGAIRRIHVDRGREFYNKHVERLMKQRNVKLYSTFSQEIKASLAERHLQTLKRLIYKYLTLRDTFKYYDVVQTLVEKYNATPHAGLKGYTPQKVHGLTKLQDIREQFNRMYRHRTQRRRYKRGIPSKDVHCFTPGQTVRITLDSRSHQAFYKGYLKRFKEEYFTVDRVDCSGRVPVYTLKDLNGEKLDGIFYSQELIAVSQPSDGVYPLRVLRTRGKGDSKKYFVEWKGYPSNFNSWVDKDALALDYGEQKKN